jgi:hypothetical protein
MGGFTEGGMLSGIVTLAKMVYAIAEKDEVIFY